jgi:hypothetical protein
MLGLASGVMVLPRALFFKASLIPGGKWLLSDYFPGRHSRPAIRSSLKVRHDETSAIGLDGSSRSRSSLRFCGKRILNFSSRRPLNPDAAATTSPRTPFGSGIDSTSRGPGNPRRILPLGLPATRRISDSSKSSHASVIRIGITGKKGTCGMTCSTAELISSIRSGRQPRQHRDVFRLIHRPG